MRALKTYAYLTDALLDQSRLADQGTESFVAGENTGTIGYGGVFNEIRLEVADEDFDRAATQLEPLPQSIPEDAIFDGGSLASLPSSANIQEPSPLLFALAGGAIAVLLFGVLVAVPETSGAKMYADHGGLFSIFMMGVLLGAGTRVLYLRRLRWGKISRQ